MTYRPTVLLTRPLTQSQEIAACLQDIKIDAMIAPMLKIISCAHTPIILHSETSVIFSSAHGVRMANFQGDKTSIPVFVVGEQTAQAARVNGFSMITIAQDGMENLLETYQEFRRNNPHTHTHYVRGQDVRMDLRTLYPDLQEHIVYRADLADGLPKDVILALTAGKITHVALYSARTAQRFAELIGKENLSAHLSRTEALCISPFVLNCVQSLPWRAVAVARRTDGQGMCALIQDTLSRILP